MDLSGFKYHLAVARLMAELTLSLSESVILPFDVPSYASFLEQDIAKIESRYKDVAVTNGATFEHFRKAVAHFRNATEYFTDNIIPRLDIINPLAVRKINDQLMQLERGFVDPHGLPGRPEFNHIVFAPSSVDKYSSDTFAGLVDLFKTVGNQTEAEQPGTWRQIKQHLSAISFLIGTAADSLREGF
ncbi:glutamate carboxypeptidase 2 [Daphnia magna]|nr:glutamate carboxypeptidase 2 [Daphnia magna]